jgi:NAD(P)-dependent dehydrogenase (short-subunit alcohol dehydrogenase family)
MTVLVTGGAGYIGSHMVHALVDAGERVVVLDNLSTGFKWAVPKDVALVVGQSGDQPRVAALIAEHRVDAIIHFAASPFWCGLKEIAFARKIKLGILVSEIDSARQHANLSSAIRLFVLDFYQTSWCSAP